MLHPENCEWEGWPLVPRDTDSVMHSEMDPLGHRSFFIMTGERERRYHGRKLVMGLRRLLTELGWRCSSAFRFVREGPSRREMRALQEELWSPFD